MGEMNVLQDAVCLNRLAPYSEGTTLVELTPVDL
jgi:hypothetical protein